MLTEKIRRNPRSVLYFSGVRSAHSAVIGILLQILDAGEIDDASGKRVDFKNCFLIFGVSEGQTERTTIRMPGITRNSSAEGYKYRLEEMLPRELFSRIEESVYIEKNSVTDLRTVLFINAKKIEEQAKREGYSLSLSEGYLSTFAGKYCKQEPQDEKKIERILRHAVGELIDTAKMEPLRGKRLCIEVDDRGEAILLDLSDLK